MNQKITPTYASIYLENAINVPMLAECGLLARAIKVMDSASHTADLYVPKPQPYNDHDVDMLVANTGSPQ